MSSAPVLDEGSDMILNPGEGRRFSLSLVLDLHHRELGLTNRQAGSNRFFVSLNSAQDAHDSVMAVSEVYPGYTLSLWVSLVEKTSTKDFRVSLRRT